MIVMPALTDTPKQGARHQRSILSAMVPPGNSGTGTGRPEWSGPSRDPGYQPRMSARRVPISEFSMRSPSISTVGVPWMSCWFVCDVTNRL